MKTTAKNKTMTYSRQRRAAGRGFTLIELMLVLVILATLAAVVLPKLSGRTKQAKIASAETQVATLQTALDAFEIDTGRYPTTAEGLRALSKQPTMDADDWMGPYLRKNIGNDPWGEEYRYRYPGTYNTEGYDLYSMGPDRKQGGDDDITNYDVDMNF
jgi:general secretion pathway protein G